jgi:peptide/nickel transport system permease protein
MELQKHKPMLIELVTKNRNIKLGVLGIVLMCAVCGIVGYLTLAGLKEDVRPAYLPPSLNYPLGTDRFGRNMVSVVTVGAIHSFEIGFLTAIFGTLLSVVFGLTAGYYSGGWLEAVLSGISRFFLVIPSFAVLVLVFSLVKFVTITLLATLIAVLSWPFAAFVMQARTLQIKQAEFVNLAKCSGLKDRQIIFYELLPNLIPYIAANFTNLFTWAILIEMGISVIGLPPNQVTLGNTLYWAIVDNALLRNMWWLWIPPTTLYILMFVFLYLVYTGLDEVANPRLKAVTGL